MKPTEEQFQEIRELAGEFLLTILLDPDTRIGISCHQVGEVLEVLRRSGLAADSRMKLLQDFQKGKFLVKLLDFPTIESAARDRAESNIHIHDYLVTYPLKGIVSRIYSADEHFRHKDFRKIGEVLNLFNPRVVVEGKKPKRIH